MELHWYFRDLGIGKFCKKCFICVNLSYCNNIVNFLILTYEVCYFFKRKRRKKREKVNKNGMLWLKQQQILATFLYYLARAGSKLYDNLLWLTLTTNSWSITWLAIAFYFLLTIPVTTLRTQYNWAFSLIIHKQLAGSL